MIEFWIALALIPVVGLVAYVIGRQDGREAQQWIEFHRECREGIAALRPVKTYPFEVLMHCPSPGFPDGIPLAPGICTCRLCVEASVDQGRNSR